MQAESTYIHIDYTCRRRVRTYLKQWNRMNASVRFLFGMQYPFGVQYPFDICSVSVRYSFDFSFPKTVGHAVEKKRETFRHIRTVDTYRFTVTQKTFYNWFSLKTLPSEVTASFACLECHQPHLSPKIWIPMESAQCGHDISITNTCIPKNASFRS